MAKKIIFKVIDGVESRLCSIGGEYRPIDQFSNGCTACRYCRRAKYQIEKAANRKVVRLPDVPLAPTGRGRTVSGIFGV